MSKKSPEELAAETAEKDAAAKAEQEAKGAAAAKKQEVKVRILSDMPVDGGVWKCNSVQKVSREEARRLVEAWQADDTADAVHYAESVLQKAYDQKLPESERWPNRKNRET